LIPHSPAHGFDPRGQEMIVESNNLTATNMKPTLTPAQQALASVIQKVKGTVVPVRPDNSRAHDKEPALKFYRNHYGKVKNPTVVLCPWCHGVSQIGDLRPNRVSAWIADKDLAYQVYLLHAGFQAGQTNPTRVDPATGRMDCNVAGIDELHGKCTCACEHQWEQVGHHSHGGRISRCKTCNAEFVQPDSR
jgi:hypothetical protein